MSVPAFQIPSPEPLQSVPSSYLINATVEKAYDDLQSLSATLTHENLDTRREELLSYVRTYRARFLKSYVAIRYLTEFGHGELVSEAKESLTVATGHKDKINETQDRLFFMHGGLFGARQRAYDVSTAVDVLSTGSYPRLPLGIKWCGADRDDLSLFPTKTQFQRQALISRVERTIKLVLISREVFPSGFTSKCVQKGRLVLKSGIEFELRLTLEEESENAPWVFCGFDMFVQARIGEANTLPSLDFRQKAYIKGLVQSAMNAATSKSDSNVSEVTPKSVLDKVVSGRPLLTAYRLLHDFCMGMQLELMYAQALALTKEESPWHDRLQVVLHREARVLDISLWPNEYKLDRVISENINKLTSTPVNGVPLPKSSRFIRIYIKDNESSESDIQIMLNSSKMTDLMNIQIFANSISSSVIIQLAAQFYVKSKLESLLPEIRNSLLAIDHSQVRILSENKVIRIEACGFVHIDITIDFRSGRCILIRSTDATKFEMNTELLMSILNQSPKKGIISYTQWQEDLKTGVIMALKISAVFEIESISKVSLGLEPQHRWGGLLGRGSTSTFRTYVVITSFYESPAFFISNSKERGIKTKVEKIKIPLTNGFKKSVMGVNWVPNHDSVQPEIGETIYLLLEVEVLEDLNLKYELLIASLAQDSKTCRPRIIGSMPLSNSANVESMLGKRLFHETSNQFVETSIEKTLRNFIDLCFTMLPWIRAHCAISRCNFDINEERSIPFRSLFLENFSRQNPPTKLKNIRFLKGMYVEFRIVADFVNSDCKMKEFAGSEYNFPIDVIPLAALTIKDEVELLCIDNIPLRTLINLVTNLTPSLCKPLEPWIAEARSLINSVRPANFLVISVSDYHIVMGILGDKRSEVCLTHVFFCANVKIAENSKIGSTELALVLPQDLSDHSKRWLKYLVERESSLTDFLLECEKAIRSDTLDVP